MECEGYVLRHQRIGEGAIRIKYISEQITHWIQRKARAVNAQAYTVGKDMMFGAGIIQLRQVLHRR